jgi:FixJ family two-component response regulator
MRLEQDDARLAMRPVIAIVDDDEALHEALADLLGFTCRGAFDGAESLLRS